METTTFRYDCTGDAPNIIKQEVHFIGDNYFFVSKVNRPEDNEIETMIFLCTEAGNVLDWSEEYVTYDDIDIKETVSRYQSILFNHGLIEKSEADACNERFRQTDGE